MKGQRDALTEAADAILNAESYHAREHDYWVTWLRARAGQVNP